MTVINNSCGGDRLPTIGGPKAVPGEIQTKPVTTLIMGLVLYFTSSSSTSKIKVELGGMTWLPWEP